ncbi:uncharacterized protein BXZ73DRAFT_48567, partial [Epithele typhae]|uniref:uncharacterized protein n=1 Tax=Epithele typhae TaxID=378194 RepID=UPI0020078979
QSLRKRDRITREAAQWMWMATHDAYMIGTKWLRPNMSPEQRDRATCKKCGSIETMDHILFECEAKGRKEIWKLLDKAWRASGGRRLKPSWGTIIAAGNAEIKMRNGKKNHDAEKRWAILISESAYLVWKLRCERVIANNGDEFSNKEIENRWYATIDRRLTLDRRVATLTESEKKRKAMIASVERVWGTLIDDSESLRHDWVTNRGVLVGIKRGR